MEKQHIPMRNKLSLFALGFLGAFALTSCALQIPDGDIKEFVEQIDFAHAKEQVVTGTSYIQAIYSENDEEKGRISITTQIDQSDKYYFSSTEASGSYTEEYNFEQQQILCYAEEDTIQAFKKTNENFEDVTYNVDDLYQLISTFFYTKVEGGYHQGAVYYGDYVVANCAKYYPCFSLNENKTILTYEVNTAQKNTEGDEIVTMHHFEIDAYGMILSLHTKSMVMEKNIVIDTTIDCTYNTQIDKKTKL
ncbi:MAG: hypothetical protein K2N64_01815 [Anaeroplasmataceae bacterium]|nr:hypothetical protein [Anaeroplasmataceae bacterium]